MRTGADTLLTAGALICRDDARMFFEGRLTHHLLGARCDAFPTGLTLMDIQTNERGRIAANEQVARAHENLLAVRKKVRIGRGTPMPG